MVLVGRESERTEGMFVGRKEIKNGRKVGRKKDRYCT